MSPKSGQHAPLPAAPVPESPDELRNVALVGPSGSGKTTVFGHLVSALLPEHHLREADPERSTELSVAAVEHEGIVINLIDTPGYADFVGELRAGLRAADAALFVISAADGVDAATTLLWEECAAVGMPRAVVVTKLDAGRADFDDTVAICQRVFGEGVQQLYLPLHGEDEAIIGNLGLLSQRIYDYSSGTRQVRDAEPRHRELIEGPRADLMEAIIQESEDDTLLERYLGGEEVSLDVVTADLLTAVARGSFHPVLPLSTETGVGTGELLHLLVSGFPPPTRHELPRATTPDGDPMPPLRCDPSAPLVAEVVRTTSDPYVGRTSLVRVFRGTLRPDTPVHVSGHLDRFAGHELESHPDHDEEERAGLLSSPLAETARPKSQAIAGDICLVARLSRAETSDTLSDRDDPALIEPWILPDALLPVAIRVARPADEDKLPAALQRVVAEDPTLRLEHNAETHQLVLWTMGPAHVDLVITHLRERFGVEVETETVVPALRETFTRAAEGHGRNVKQSGGHGQYAICDIRVEPLPRGAGIEFAEEVVGGAVPRQFIPGVEKGVRAQLAKGCLGGYPVVDVRVVLTGGKAHSVDSSDQAFQTAGALAVRDAADQGAVALLEPLDLVHVVVADEYVGAVMNDLQSRRGRVIGSVANSSGHTTIDAEVPQSGLARYPIDLRSISQGTGTFTREPLRHDLMPGHLAAEHLPA
ncbi:elongation factor G-like protein EF-G2 [Segeticoccus rhizosphaerae]|uniref:elongation factor G-like protein EF-G2 n=1 Tax=Segeticoccus rhizosphaerae TaxID=1104777 RepID=UPI001264B46D|nr:elongation factor G-like protein EF-G2 [Segeticoccus rhizosphaerae]